MERQHQDRAVAESVSQRGSTETEALQKSARTWMVGVGLPSLAIGVGLTMTGYLNFWAGIGTSLIGIGLISIEWWELSKHKGSIWRLGGITVIAAKAYPSSSGATKYGDKGHLGL